MEILTHGSDLALARTVTPIVRSADGRVVSAVTQLARCGFKAVQLDATLSGIRPRDLDRRARRDLLAVLNRQSVQLAGIDLFVPRTHFEQSQYIDRAITATLNSIELAADLGRIPLSVALPVEQLDQDVKDTLIKAADGRGVRLAVHAEDQLDALQVWVDEVDLFCLGVAIDPAALLSQSQDPVTVVQNLGNRLAVARLRDWSGEGIGSCPVGRGELDMTRYRVVLDLAPGRVGPVVLDLRGQDNVITSAAVAMQAWESAGFSV